jgi:hypothetical protein
MTVGEIQRDIRGVQCSSRLCGREESARAQKMQIYEFGFRDGGAIC